MLIDHTYRTEDGEWRRHKEWHTVKSIREYPWCLLDAVYGGQDFYPWKSMNQNAPESISVDTVPDDLIASIEYVVYTLTERERTVLLMYCKDKMTLKEIGQKIGVTLERVRQILAKSFRKLRWRDREKFIRYGVSGVIRNESMKSAEITIELERERADKEARILRQQSNSSNQGEQSIRETVMRYQSIDAIPIETLNLSIRPYNCLIRQKIYTIGDIMKLSQKELLKVRNLGKKSYAEVVESLERVGLDCSNFKEFGQWPWEIHDV